MLEADNFNNQEFQDIVDMAKKQISFLNSDWTNMQEYDPGITIIDLFAWLKIIQVEYMKFISRDSLYKFLDLLNTHANYNKGSRTLITLDNLDRDVLIPKGTKWLTDDGMIFENENVQFVFKTKIKSITFNNPDFQGEIQKEDFDNKRAYYIFGENLNKNKNGDRLFTIHFDAPIAKGSPASIYFNVDSKWSKIRNPVKPSDDFIEMANISWEYYGIKDGIKGWHKIDNVKDNTHSFLFSNTIKFDLMGDMIPINGNFEIRATLLSQSYDYPPIIRNINMNVFSVTQKDTKCESTTIKKKDIKNGKYVDLYTNMALYGNHTFYVKSNGSWVEIEAYRFERNIEGGYTRFEFKGIEKYLNKLENKDQAIIIVSYSKDLQNHTKLASGTGISNQKVELNCKDILYKNFHIMVGKHSNEGIVYDKWNKVTSFFSSSKYSKHYILDWENDSLNFGNNEMGIAPSKIKDNIRLLSMAYTQGSNSNIKSYMIKNVSTNNTILKSVKITQLNQATGGMDNDTFQEIKNKPVKVFNNINRAVTISDYETLVRRTPGLIIENMKVLPSYLPNGIPEPMNCITIAIQQGEFANEGNYLESYSKNIKEYLNRYRLINTKIEVTGPSYVGIKIRGDVTINSYEDECKHEIEEGIKNFIKKLNRNLGRTLYFGELFGTIEQMDCVIYLEDLHIIPVGNYVKRTKSDDIIVQPNGAYYIENINLNYLKSANF